MKCEIYRAIPFTKEPLKDHLLPGRHWAEVAIMTNCSTVETADLDCVRGIMFIVKQSSHGFVGLTGFNNAGVQARVSEV